MQSVMNRVVECIAVTTRYPRELLVPSADLEDDLGIDSVKRVEIVTALQEEFELELVTKERDPSIRTIEHIAHWIEGELSGSSAQGQNGRAQQPLSSRAFLESKPSRTDSWLEPEPEPDARITGVTGNRLSPAHLTPRPPHTSVLKSCHASTRGPLEDRIALITGSGRGVGRTIARVLAARGATVIINSFHSREQGEQTTAELNAAGATALHLWGSVANPDQVEDIFDQIEQQFGRLDILVCNASDGRLGALTSMTHADWERAFHTNVTGHHHCAVRASKLMQRAGGGSIVTMSSIGAHRYVQGLGAQGVVKAAVESLTRYLACELSAFGIRTNCVSGGPVYGGVMSQYPEARATFNYWESIVPDGELCSPMDFANTIAFLVSDDARGINGAIWTVDHGASTRAHSRQLPEPGAFESLGSQLS